MPASVEIRAAEPDERGVDDVDDDEDPQGDNDEAGGRVLSSRDGVEGGRASRCRVPEAPSAMSPADIDSSC